MEVTFLTLEDVRGICYEYARAHLSYDEPLPDFGTRFPDKLESALFAPQRIVGGGAVYPDLPSQAAALFYEMVMQHPFLNGNKRMACVSLMVFLAINDRWLEMTWKSLYDIAVTVANSRNDNREGVLNMLTGFIERGLREF